MFEIIVATILVLLSKLRHDKAGLHQFKENTIF